MKYNDSKVENEISRAFHKHYGLNVASIKFIPVGEESHAYKILTDQGDKYFVKYCEQPDVIKNINRVNDLLLELKHFPFVVPPVQAGGQTSFDVLKGKMYVYPFIGSEVIRMGNHKFNKELVKELTKIMASIHNSTTSVDLPRERFENNFTQRLEKLLLSANNSELEDDVRQLLIDNERVIRSLIEKHNAISDKYSAKQPRFVLTHGDITGLNLIKSEDGIKLVDWDGAMFAPAEKDVNFLYDNPNFSIDEYLTLTRQTHFESELKDFYGQDWSLNSIIGNFESILNQGKAKGDKSGYIDEINEYLGYYK